ncbi:MAG: hypothetical protein PHD72_03170 [Patescibacteria group bacterium]|nr:hypothetical protein [Patescibacteria group bacterium]
MAAQNLNDNNEEDFDLAAMTKERQRQAELDSARARARRAAALQLAGAQIEQIAAQNRAPAQEEATLGHGDIGEGAAKKPAKTEEEGAEQEETPEGEGGLTEEQQATAAGQREMIGGQPTGAARAAITNAQRQINLLTKQTKKISQETEKKLFVPKKTYQASQMKDRWVNAVKIIRYMGALVASLWWTIVVPLIAILVIIAVFLLTLAGFNLGPSSVATRKLKMEYEMAKQKAKAEEERQAAPLQKQIRQYYQQINQLNQ